ncbi:MAG: Xaa-Pro peptidase family protein [Dysgonamonadaceae bacterium]|jgi:Xaa-Pro aminopeptidase|nr:Xaa-Pro peptidase family protein [Dysgonamonadaceae bacterium]
MNTDTRQSVKRLLLEERGDACLVSTFVNQYYLAGKLFKGYIYLPADGETLFFVQRETYLTDSQVFQIRKPEDIPGILQSLNYPLPKTLFLETGQISHNDFLRLEAAFRPDKTGDATALLRRARMIKSPWEIGQFRISAQKHAEVYSRIPSLFREGMKDIDFQIEIEHLMRRNGSLGIFRTFGDMDIFMGSLLTGSNAAAPAPYDFALGGAGMHPCLPIGCSGETIGEGNAVMVDFAGNFTAYMSDMTRVFAYGKLPDEVQRAHQLSIDMHNRLREEVRPGVSCASVWQWSLAMAEDAGFGGNFMGTSFQAKFVGHGVGLEINEPPVLMARSKDVFRTNMVFAYEPKFVFEGIGAVGNENTFLVTGDGIENMTVFDERIGQLTK